MRSSSNPFELFLLILLWLHVASLFGAVPEYNQNFLARLPAELRQELKKFRLQISSKYDLVDFLMAAGYGFHEIVEKILKSGFTHFTIAACYNGIVNHVIDDLKEENRIQKKEIVRILLAYGVGPSAAAMHNAKKDPDIYKFMVAYSTDPFMKLIQLSE